MEIFQVFQRNKELEDENKKLTQQVIKLKGAIAYITGIDFPYLIGKYGDEHVYQLLDKTYREIVENEKYAVKEEGCERNEEIGWDYR